MRQRGPLVEERLVLELEHGQVDSRADRLDRGGQLLAGLLALHEELAGVEDHVGVGQDPLAVDDDPGAAGLAGLCLVQGRRMSGYRSVAEILTTDSRMSFSRVLSEACSAEAITGDARPTLATIISDIRVSLGIFIAGTRMRCRKPIANRMAGNRMSWPRKKKPIRALRRDGAGSRNN